MENYRTLGKTKLNINPLGFGGIPIQRVTREESRDIIEEAIKLGVNFFDSARGYTCSEEYLGDVLPKYRDKVYIATKSMSRTYQDMKNDIMISLNNFKTSYIDLYQCHNVSKMTDFEKIMSDDGAIKALCEAKEQGLVKHIGITSHSLDFIKWLINSEYKDLFETVQIPYNFLEPEAEEVLKRCKELQIGTIAMKPLGGGVIDNSTPAIKYLFSNDNLSVLIPGMGSIEEVTKNVQAANDFHNLVSFSNEKLDKLNADEKEYINKLKAEVKGEFCHRCGYCLPCPKGIDIPSLFTLENYFDRYGLKNWALTRYKNTKVKADECISCQACVKKCPYQLDIPSRLKRIHNKFYNYEG